MPRADHASPRSGAGEGGMASTSDEAGEIASDGRDRGPQDQEREAIAIRDDPSAYFESKEIVLRLLRTFAEHGCRSLEEVIETLGRSSEPAASFPSPR